MAGLFLNLCAECGQPFEVQIDGPRSEITSTRQCNADLAQPAEQRPHHLYRCPHAPDGVFGSFVVQTSVPALAARQAPDSKLPPSSRSSEIISSTSARSGTLRNVHVSDVINAAARSLRTAFLAPDTNCTFQLSAALDYESFHIDTFTSTTPAAPCVCLHPDYLHFELQLNTEHLQHPVPYVINQAHHVVRGGTAAIDNKIGMNG